MEKKEVQGLLLQINEIQTRFSTTNYNFIEHLLGMAVAEISKEFNLKDNKPRK
ncbi:MAG: hypothetical protein AAF569_09165 [Pseudomonadota bacterium]